MMSRIFLLTALISFKVLAVEVPEYKAKYQFDSEEISITGIREFTKNENGYELKFRASNLVASMYFSSLFAIEDNQIKSSKYNIKIRPKFLKRDQSVIFNQQENLIQSNGQKSWQTSITESESIFDPLNVQIMIRIYINSGFERFNLNILDMEEGGFKKYHFEVKNIETCVVNNIEYKCKILERSREGTQRIVKYYLAKELDYMFVKIIDTSPDRTNKLELKEILSFG